MKISGDSPNRAFVSKEHLAGKNTAKAPQDGSIQNKPAVRDGSGSIQNKPAVRGDSPLRPAGALAGNADLASLLKLPQDGLSRSIIAFARFFSLPLEPKFLAGLRRDALGAAAREAALGTSSREAAALGAAAAADKGIKLGEKALKEYAAAIEGRPESFAREGSAGTPAGAEKSRGDASRLLSETDPDGKGSSQDTPPDSQGEGSSQDTSSNPQGKEDTQNHPKTGLSAPELQLRITEILEERPLLDLINRIPGKNGRWVVIPFSFCEDGVEFAVSLRILLNEGSPISDVSLVSGSLNADIRVSRLGREQRRWLISLEKAEGGIRAELGVFSASGPWNFSAAERKRLKQELAAALDVPFDKVAIREDAPLFAESRENTLRSVNEEV